MHLVEFSSCEVLGTYSLFFSSYSQHVLLFIYALWDEARLFTQVTYVMWSFPYLGKDLEQAFLLSSDKL